MKRGIYQGIVVGISLLLVVGGAYGIPHMMSSNQQQITMDPSKITMNGDERHGNNRSTSMNSDVSNSPITRKDSQEGGPSQTELESNRDNRDDDKSNTSVDRVEATTKVSPETEEDVSSPRDSNSESASNSIEEDTTETAEDSTDNIQTTEDELPEGLNEDEEIVYVKYQWVNDMIQENRQDISDTDLNEGVPIYDKLDSGYLFSLAEDGLTEDEEKEAKAYMESHLSGSELSRAMELYNKYIGLVNND